MNILILNVHSALNLGDDGIMYETLRSLRSAYPNAMITIAANDPDSWQKYDNVHIVGSLTTWVVDSNGGVWRWRKPLMLIHAGLLMSIIGLYRLFGLRLMFGRQEQRRLLLAYYDADLVLSCGGGNFYAHRAMSPGFVWSILILALAVFLDKKVVLLPQSIGPIEGRFQRLLARLVFSRSGRILLREHLSLAFLKELKVRRPAVVLPDLAFGLPSVMDAPNSLIQKRKALPRIGVTVMDRAAQEKRFVRQQIYEDALVSLLVRLRKDHRAQLYIFVQCYGPASGHDDRHSARRVYDRVSQQVDGVTLLDAFQGALEIRAAYKQMDCVIGTRMHTGVFALSNAVPVVLIGYQPKAFGTMTLFGLERYCCNIETVTSDELYEMVCEVLDNRAEIRKHVAQRIIQVQESLQGWVRYLED